MSDTVHIYGVGYSPKVGTFVLPGSWSFGEKLTASDWDKAKFRLGRRDGVQSVAVNVVLTGGTLQRRSGNLWIRAKITFVGDGEPDQVVGGWVLAETAKEN
jgi:hypothetical protein